jgi:Paired amphipathic helix repeat/Sin3 family co-repressor
LTDPKLKTKKALLIMRELRVEDALLYLDQVKVEFGDRPHIYNEFLDIMKTFKTQQIDTLEVIHRVSTLFQGNRRLVLGFNTFLPEGYKIEIPEDGQGPQVPVYRVPGSNVIHSLQDTTDYKPLGLSMSAPASGMRIPPQQPNSVTNTTIQPTVHRPLPSRTEPAYPTMSVGGAQANMPPNNTPAMGFPPNNTPAMGFPPPDSATNAARGPLAHNLQSDTANAGPRPPAQTLDAASSMAPSRHSQIHHPQQLPGGVTVRIPEQMSGLQSSQTKSPSLPVPHQQHQRANQQGRDVKVQGMGRGQRPGTIPPGPSPKRQLEVPKGPLFEHQSPAQQRQPTQPQQQHIGLPPQPTPQILPKSQKQTQKPAQQPLEFDHAINYVTTIKRRFASEPETYKKFLEILHTYQKEQRGIKEVLDDVSNLFEDHPDLLKEFTYFLPDAVQAQAKAQLDAVAKEAEARKQKKAKDAIMITAQTMQQHVKTIQDQNQRGTLNTTQGRSADRDSSIIRRVHHGKVSFEPMRPPRKNALTPTQAAARFGRPVSIPEAPNAPNTVETAFFQRAKEHLNRKELAADKPAGSRRHTPWSEFLKCLHLFGVGILNREELLLLLKGLFVLGHAPKTGANASSGSTNSSVLHDATDLLKEFEDILIRRGPYARQESLIKDRSKYGTLRARDFDYGNCENPTPSYWSYPADYPKHLFLSHPGQTSDDVKVLDEKFLCVSRLFDDNDELRPLPSIEDSLGSRTRHNVCEAMMFRIEDERYELDMAIERNVHALRSIEPYAEEAKSLREQEEKDGQPIGRLRYKLNRCALNSIHVNAIGRIYGDRGDEVLQNLLCSPLICLPIIYQRLKQKDIEWRKAKVELSERLSYLQESNYEGSLDVQFYYNRRELESTFSLSLLKKQCERVRSYIKHPEKLVDHAATIRFKPSFGTRLSDFGAVLHQPYLETKCKVDMAHKYAFDLLSFKLKCNPNISSLNHERIGRIWAELFVPWFEYPTHWVTGEVRESFGGKLTSTMVKCESRLTLFLLNVFLSFY